MAKEIIVNDNVDIITYSAAVQAIAEKFFDVKDNYTPYFGRINAVTVFFNYFVDDESLTDYFSDMKDEITTDFIVRNEECLNLYNKALQGTGTYRLDFANAYKDAMEVVYHRRSSVGNIIDRIQKAVSEIADVINPVFSGDNLDKLTEITKNVADGNLSAESIVEAYGNSKRLEEVLDKK